MKTKKILLTRTVVYKGKHYPPESDHEWPEDIVDELIEKDAGEPVLDVVGTKDQPEDDQLEDGQPDLKRQTEIVFAAQEVIDNDQVIGSGAPDIKAMEKLLGYDISAPERDNAWEILKKEQGNA
ncbi:MAG: hypothetical protein GY864_13730 [Desulfobacterales bacterium]|nr:hypothetical protein [Desulfobacterales bacterium]